MFRGTAIVKPDAKGRIVIPNRFRKELEREGQEDLIITGHPYGYLLLMFKSKYEALERTVIDKPDSGMTATMFKHSFIGLVEYDLALDKAGRIPLSPGLRDHAKINGEVSLSGMREYICIWSTDQLNTFREKVREEAIGSNEVRVPEGWDDFRI